eukprot:Nk52_evm32s152 gene=Nk52_evmTU32s152
MAVRTARDPLNPGWIVSIVLSLILIIGAVVVYTQVMKFKGQADSMENYLDFMENFSIYLNSARAIEANNGVSPAKTCTKITPTLTDEDLVELKTFNSRSDMMKQWRQFWADKFECADYHIEYYRVHYTNGKIVKKSLYEIQEIASSIDCEDGPFPEDLGLKESIFPMECTAQDLEKSPRACGVSHRPFYWCGERYDPKSNQPMKHDCGHLDICATIPDHFNFPNLNFSSSLAFAGFAQGYLATSDGNFKIKTLYRRYKNFVNESVNLGNPQLQLNRESKEIISEFNTKYPNTPDGCHPISYWQLVLAQTYCAYKYPKACKDENDNALCGSFNWTPSHPGGAWKVYEDKGIAYRDYVWKGEAESLTSEL